MIIKGKTLFNLVGLVCQKFASIQRLVSKYINDLNTEGTVEEQFNYSFYVVCALLYGTTVRQEIL